MWLLFFCLIGGCMGHSLFVLKDEIHCTEGTSVYLPASYKLSQPFQMWPSFLWSKGKYNILYYSLLNGSIDGNGFPTRSSGECTIFPRYAGRVEFSEHNASLVLKDVQQDDSGSYSLTLISAESTLSKKIHLRVAGRNPSFNSREETLLGSILSPSSEIREEYVKKLQDTYSHNETTFVFVCVTVLLFASIIFLSTYIRRINAKCYTDVGNPTYACVKEKYLHKDREALGRQSLLGKQFRLGKAVVVGMQSPINPLKPAVCKRLTDEDSQ